MSDTLATGAISRRRFTQMAALLLSASPLALGATRGWAAEGELVFVNWGGDAGPA